MMQALNTVFVRLLNISIAAGWIILVAAVLRKLFKKAPKWVACLLWLVVALRLVMPFSIESPLSLLPSARTVVVKSAETAPREDAPAGEKAPSAPGAAAQPSSPAANPDISVLPGSTEATPGTASSAPSDVPDAQQPSYTPMPRIEIDSGLPYINSFIEERLPEAESEGSEPAARTLSQAFRLTGTAWLGGVVVMAVYAAASYIRLRRRVAASLAAEEQSGVFFCDGIDAPFILGIFRPRIYLNSGISQSDRDFILSHERAHILRRDHLWKPLGFALLAVYWFNPLMWLAYALFCRDIELACDEKVIKQLGDSQRAEYSRTILKFSAKQRAVTACPVAFGETGAKTRIRSVLSYKKPAIGIIAAAVVTCAVLAVCFLTDPALAASPEEGTELPEEPLGEAFSYHYTDVPFAEGNDIQGEYIVWFNENSAERPGEIQPASIPGAVFKLYEGENGGDSIYMLKDGQEQVVYGRGLSHIDSAYFCDLDKDGTAELYISTSIHSFGHREEIRMYTFTDGIKVKGLNGYLMNSFLWEDHGNIFIRSYNLGNLFMYEDAAEGLLVLRDGEPAVGPIPESTAASYANERQRELKQLSAQGRAPELTVHTTMGAPAKVAAQSYSWYCNGQIVNGEGGAEGLAVVKAADSFNGAVLSMSFPVEPDSVSIYYTDSRTGEVREVAVNQKPVSFGVSAYVNGTLTVNAWWGENSHLTGHAVYEMRVVTENAPDEYLPSFFFYEPYYTGRCLTIEGRRYFMGGRPASSGPKNFFLKGEPAKALPAGFTYAGKLSKEQASDSGLAGYSYYTSPGVGTVYVLMPTERLVQLDDIALGLQMDKDGKIFDDQWFYLPWSVKEGSMAQLDGTRLMTVYDLQRIWKLHRKDLAWSDFSDYSALTAQGGGKQTYYIENSDYRLQLTGDPDGAITTAELIHLPDGAKANLAKDDIKAFMAKYPQNAAEEKIRDLLDNYPQLFGLDSRGGLTVCVRADSPGLYESGAPYLCLLLPGTSANVSYIESRRQFAVFADLAELGRIIDSYGLPAEKIIIRPYYDPASGQVPGLTEREIADKVAGLFGGRYRATERMSFVREETGRMDLVKVLELAEKGQALSSGDFTMPYFETELMFHVRYKVFNMENHNRLMIGWPEDDYDSGEILFARLIHTNINNEIIEEIDIRTGDVRAFAEKYPDLPYKVFSGKKPGVSGPDKVQGDVYVWFDARRNEGVFGVDEKELEAANRTEVRVPGFPGITFTTDTLRISMKKDQSETVLIEGLPVENAFFCDLNGDGLPELCATCLFGSGMIDERIRIYDIANDRFYEAADRGNFDYSLSEREGWLVVSNRAYEKTSSVGWDKLLTIKNGAINFAPLAKGQRNVVRLMSYRTVFYISTGESPLIPYKDSAYAYNGSYITINEERFYITEAQTHYLPYGYKSRGPAFDGLPAESLYSDSEYYMAEGHDDLYLSINGSYRRFTPVPKDFRTQAQSLTLELVIYLANKDELSRGDFSPLVLLENMPDSGEKCTIPTVDDRFALLVRFNQDGKADALDLIYDGGKETVNLFAEDAEAYINSFMP